MARFAALVDDALFLAHRARGPHPERPERLRAMRRAVELSRDVLSFELLPPRDATAEELGRIHSGRYLKELGQSAGHWGELDADTYLSPESVSAAWRAAGGAVALAEALWEKPSSCGVALLRPPGHHARPDAAMGFCLLNNAAIAAAHARSLGAERVIVLDWDVHHGNGTQEAFYADPEVLYISLHQSPYYPGSGGEDETGAGDGRGYTLNLPLAAGGGDALYLSAFERIVAPVVEQYAPDVVLVSAGFDAHARDPLGGMQLSDGAYFWLTRRLMGTLAAKTRVGIVLEGGYDLAGLEGSLKATLHALGGADLDPLEPLHPTPAEQRQLAHLESAARKHWYLG